MKFIKTLLITFLVLICPIIIAQEMTRPSIDVQLFVEKIFAAQESDVDYNDLYESLLQFYVNPIDINKVDKEALRGLYILNELQLTSFFAYREKNGAFISIYELQAIPNLDLITIQNLLPFVTIQKTKTDTRSLLERVLSEDNNYLLRYERTLESKKGYGHNNELGGPAYYGDPNKLYARFRISKSKDFSFGFTAEKDAGENLIWDPKTKRYGMDYYSFHAQIMNQGNFKNIIVGDYQIQHGQGLITSAGFSVGKGSETITTVRRNQLGIRPYTSAIETNFHRGAAATYKIGRFDMTGFFSNRLNDGVIQTDSSSAGIEKYTTALQITGLHRTENEIKSKNQIREQNFGSTIYYQSTNKNLQVGAAILYTNYNTAIKRAINYYNQFEFNGRSNYIYGLSGSYQWQNTNFFGEVAQSKSGGAGGIVGLLTSLTHKLDLAITIRYYEKDFHTFYGLAFGENTRNINESGIYWGIKYKHNTRWTLSAYYDKYQFPWLRYQVKSPSNGAEYLAKIEYKPRRGTVLYFQFREEVKPKVIESIKSTVFDNNGRSKKQNYIFNFDYPIGQRVSCKTRFQFGSYRHNTQFTNGFAIMQDVSATLGQLNFSLRYALFNTDDYENRQYIYEKDMLYSFSIPAYYGIGTRAYVVGRYKLTRNFQIQAKYSITHYRDRETISSGNEKIDGNVKQDVKLQLKLSF